MRLTNRKRWSVFQQSFMTSTIIATVPTVQNLLSHFRQLVTLTSKKAHHTQNETRIVKGHFFERIEMAQPVLMDQYEYASHASRLEQVQSCAKISRNSPIEVSSYRVEMYCTESAVGSLTYQGHVRHHTIRFSKQQSTNSYRLRSKKLKPGWTGSLASQQAARPQSHFFVHTRIDQE